MNMKKMISRVLVFALLACMMLTVVSCAKKLSGTYEAGADIGIAGVKTSYTFKGSKVTVTITGSLVGNSDSTSYEGTYEIKEAEDGSMTIDMTFTDDEAKEYSVTNKVFKEDKDAGTITIGLITYTKKD